MRIQSRNGEMTLYLERGERHETRVVGQNHVHAIFNPAGRKIYTYVDVDAAVALSRPRVRIRRPWGIGRDGDRMPLLGRAEGFVAYALSRDWRRGVRVAS